MYTDISLPIIGGGVIGLSIGWQLLRAGIQATIYEGRYPKASEVAAGMVAPCAEAVLHDTPLLQLGRESLALYPRFLKELEEDSGVPLSLSQYGTLLVGIDNDDSTWLKRIYSMNKVPMTQLSGDEAREMEPLLSPRITNALLIEEDTSLNPKQVLSCLKHAFLARGGKIRSQHIETLPTHCVVAAGAWSSRFGAEVHPIKGQIVTLSASHSLHYMIRSPRIYLTPNGSHIRVGATSEEVSYDLAPQGEALRTLLQDGWEILPALDHMEVVSFETGLRPATHDQLPVLEQKGSIFFATGHGRSGFLLAPYTAYKLKERICRYYSMATSQK